ncbi:unnamed protein product [Protopolystoma xenopodis]|uniref:Uncharacterized protein n=1 Tax=Protopolystoma xenopodis TaxID=117903 RepID=A0A3S5AFC0_9PLAT|nr:unnamed protein product [Protopolystoma xenopodis]
MILPRIHAPNGSSDVSPVMLTDSIGLEHNMQLWEAADSFTDSNEGGKILSETTPIHQQLGEAEYTFIDADTSWVSIGSKKLSAIDGWNAKSPCRSVTSQTSSRSGELSEIDDWVEVLSPGFTGRSLDNLNSLQNSPTSPCF